MPDILKVRNGFFDLFHVFFVTGRQNMKRAKSEFFVNFFCFLLLTRFAEPGISVCNSLIFNDLRRRGAVLGKTVVSC